MFSELLAFCCGSRPPNPIEASPTPFSVTRQNLKKRQSMRDASSSFSHASNQTDESVQRPKLKRQKSQWKIDTFDSETLKRIKKYRAKLAKLEQLIALEEGIHDEANELA